MQIVSPTLLKEISDFIEDAASKLTESTLVLDSPKVFPPEVTELSKLIGSEETYAARVVFPYTLNSEAGENKGEAEVYIPVPIQNMLVICGKLKTIFNTMTNLKSLWVTKEPTDDEESTGVLKVFGISCNISNNQFISADDNLSELPLSPQEKQILSFCLKRKVDDITLTPSLINELWSTELPSMDHPVFKGADSYQGTLSKVLKNWASRRPLMGYVRNSLFREKKLILTTLTNHFEKALRTAARSTQTPIVSNSLYLQALSGKLEVNPMIEISQDYFDLIDPLDAPINKNMNKINQLNKCCVVEDGTFHILCKTWPGLKDVKVDYLTYKTSPVIKADYFDGKKLLSNIVKISQYGDTYEVEASKLGECYIEPSYEDKLGVVTRQIPLVNISDPARVFMGAAMFRQAIQPINPETPLLYTEHEGDAEENGTTNIYSPIEGEVTEVGADYIVVKGDDAEYKIPFSAVPGLYNNTLRLTAQVSVGSHISKGDLLARPSDISKKGYLLGVNARVAYMYYQGYNHEDAIVVSESFSKKLANVQYITVNLQIKPGDSLYSILNIGSLVASSQKLGLINRYLTAQETSLSGVKLLQTLMDALHLDTDAIDLRVPPGVMKGVVTKLEYSVNPNAETIIKNWTSTQSKSQQAFDTSLATLEKYKSLPKVNFPSWVDTSKLPTLGMPEFGENDLINVAIQIASYIPAKQGTKLTNRWGSKGLISLVLPDDEMPTDSKGQPFEMLLSPASVIARGNVAQFYETLLIKLRNKLQTLEPTDELLSSVNKIGLSAVLTKENWEEELSRGMKVSCYSTILLDNLLALCKELGVSEKEEVLIDGEPLENEVLTGYEYFLRLYHDSIYTSKITPEDNDAIEESVSAIRAGGQSIGEMEGWALLARGTYNDIIPSSREREYSLLTQLAAAGLTINESL